MCYLFGKLIFKSYINESLDFEETRILKILQVLNNTVEIEIEDTGEPDDPKFLKPNASGSKSKSPRVFKIKFEDFENLLKSNSELCIIDDTISKIFIRDLKEYNPKFSYTHTKTFKHL